MVDKITMADNENFLSRIDSFFHIVFELGDSFLKFFD